MSAKLPARSHRSGLTSFQTSEITLVTFIRFWAGLQSFPGAEVGTASGWLDRLGGLDSFTTLGSAGNNWESPWIAPFTHRLLCVEEIHFVSDILLDSAIFHCGRLGLAYDAANPRLFKESSTRDDFNCALSPLRRQCW